MHSALEHPTVINDYLQVEVSGSRVAGPFTCQPIPGLHISHFGVIPQNNQLGKSHLILNLSSLEGHRVNDGILKPPFSVQHVTVDAFIADIMAVARELSWPSLMWRVLTEMWPSILEISFSWE